MTSGANRVRRYVQITSTGIILFSVLLFVLNVAFNGKYAIALPLVFLLLGGAFYIMAFVLTERWQWAVTLFIPGSILAALGLIFLLNILTNDWNSWAYAWLLLVAGIGAGVMLSSWYGHWRQEFGLAGAGAILLGITFFVVFGMITGGPVIMWMAPLLLALGGLVLRFVRLETILPDSLLRRFEKEPEPQLKPAVQNELPVQRSAQLELVEPLSAREIEVLRLITQGLSNQEIASRLSVATSTVKTHINNIYGKLDVQTRVQAVNRAKELGILE